MVNFQRKSKSHHPIKILWKVSALPNPKFLFDPIACTVPLTFWHRNLSALLHKINIHQNTIKEFLIETTEISNKAAWHKSDCFNDTI